MKDERYRAIYSRLMELADAKNLNKLLLNQKEAAELVGVSRTTLWRRGIYGPLTLEELARELANKKSPMRAGTTHKAQ